MKIGEIIIKNGNKYKVISEHSAVKMLDPKKDKGISDNTNLNTKKFLKSNRLEYIYF